MDEAARLGTRSLTFSKTDDSSKQLLDLVDGLSEQFQQALDDVREMQSEPSAAKAAAKEPEPEAPELDSGATEAEAALVTAPSSSSEPRSIQIEEAAPRPTAPPAPQVTAGQRLAGKLSQKTPAPTPEVPAASTASAEPSSQHAAALEAATVSATEPEAPATQPPATTTVSLGTKESAQIMQQLQSIQQQTQLQAPNPNTLSAAAMAGLKEVNPALAQQVQSTQDARPSGALATVERARQAADAAKTTAKHQAPTKDKLDELKSKLVEQLRYHLRLALRGNKQEMQMALKPGFLGNVKIRMLMEDSSVTASFMVDNESVKELMQRSVDQLQEILKENGLEMEEFEVGVASDSESGNNGHGKAFASTENQKAAREWMGSIFRWTREGEDAGADAALAAHDVDLADGLDIVA